MADTVESEELYNHKEYHDLNTSGNDFGYDANGNMLYDLDRDIVTIRYNLLNLPDTVQFRDGRQIINKYAADGKRLASTYYTPTHITVQPLSIGEVHNCGTYPPYLLDRVRTWFVDNKEYGLMYPEHYDYLELKKVYTDEGYVTTNGQSDNCDYHYYRRDHLGNVREVWKPSGDSTLTVQRTRYYPSGLPKQTSQNEALQPYKYGGKEFVEGHGWDMYNSQARWYYPTTMRTTTPDPLAEKYYDTSPYTWCGNNPVNAVDPDGRELRYANNVSKEFQKQFTQTVQYMNSKGTGGLLKKIHEQPETIYITEGKKRSFFSPKTNTIYWNPTTVKFTQPKVQLQQKVNMKQLLLPIKKINNMKKTMLIFIWLLSMSYCSYSQKPITIDSISFEYVDMDIDTPFSINCNDFETFFQEEIKSTIIKDSNTIMQIINVFENLPRDTVNLYPPDTRIKMKLYSKGNNQEICIGRFNVLVNDKLYSCTYHLQTILKPFLGN